MVVPDSALKMLLSNVGQMNPYFVKAPQFGHYIISFHPVINDDEEIHMSPVSWESNTHPVDGEINNTKINVKSTGPKTEFLNLFGSVKQQEASNHTNIQIDEEILNEIVGQRSASVDYGPPT